MDRRTFAAVTTAALAYPAISTAAAGAKTRVAVIGHTGRGNFGHGLDTVWMRMPETQIVGVADANATGMEAAKKRLKTDAGFQDYRQMLKAIKPDVVAVCPRQPDQHRDMALAAIEAGAKGLYIEKPFCRTPAEADEILAAGKKHNTKLAVAHRNRYHPTLKTLDKLIADGALGKVLELRGRGKGDRRGGGEDLWVLGSHVLNLLHYFGGDPQTCSAVMRQDGRRVAKDDVREGNEALGLLAGNEVHARYEMKSGVVAYFDSIANDGTRNAGFGMQIVGSEGIVDINCDRHPLAYLVAGNPFKPGPTPRAWTPISSAGPAKPEPLQDLAETVSHHVGPARDLLASIRDNRDPLCGPKDAATTVEMICAVFDSHRRGSRAVALPLKFRGNALSQL